MTVQRAISNKFMNDLKDGFLQPIRHRILKDDTLMLALRGNYINVYYRGGSILKLSEGAGKYGTNFDRNYLKEQYLDLPTQLATDADVSAWLRQLPRLKAAMDSHFATEKRAAEREFQQLVSWENNRSPISNETEYFITDIEFADSDLGARIDMLGVRWLSHERRSENALAPVLFEMKYGNKALEGRSGLLDHFKHIALLLKDKDKCKQIRETIEAQFTQLRQLELLCFNQSSRFQKPLLSTAKPQVVFLLANYNPRSSILKNFFAKLKDLKAKLEDFKKEPNGDFDLRFFVAAFAGYGMHDACMLDIAGFSDLVDNLMNKASRRASS